MRILSDIVEDLTDGQMPSHEECYYALQVYRLMFNMEHRQLRDELLKERRAPESMRKIRANNSFNSFKGALSKSPKEWLGVDSK